MKRIFTLSICTIISAFLHGQLPVFSEHAITPSSINPALTAYHSDALIHAHYYNTFSGAIDNATTANIIGEYSFDKNKAGIQLMHDNFGVDIQNIVSLNYARHFKVANGTISGGVSFTGKNIARELSKTHPASSGDPTLQADISKTLFNIGAGVAYITNDAFIAIGTPSFMQENIAEHDNNTDASSEIPLFINGAYRIPLNDTWNITPAVFTALENGQPLILDLQAAITWHEHLKATIGYGNDHSWLAGIHARFNDRYTLGYIYDMHLPLGVASHEVMLGFDLNSSIF
ncbi:MAG: PorP/SprF family type IX secretion system membrane protein [Chitinophagales bacterium]|nr:PorP/SprF family type IX secretion system membrane protein [Chitinophagales bacterium]